jgi:histidinol dehydrogenase
VEDFGSWRQEQRLDRTGLGAILATISELATAEGLTAHRLAAQLRFEGSERE